MVLPSAVGTATGAEAAEGAGAPTAGATTYTHTDLIGGTDLNFFLLDNMVLTVGVDFSFDNSTGTITLLLSTWVTSSNLVIPYNQLV